MQRRVVMMRGLPASGKSTEAIKIVKESGGNYVRVNRDLIREMLLCGTWKPQREDEVVDAEMMVVLLELYKYGKNVVIDDCNLSAKHEVLWRDLITDANAAKAGFGKYYAVFEVMDIKTPVEECVARELKRNKVGPHVIYSMALQHGRMNPNEKYILCDLDGTLCDIKHRLHHVHKQPKDWKSFFAGIPNDTLREDVLADVAAWSLQHKAKVVFVSARPEDYRDVTEAWLKVHVDIPWMTLLMRNKGDSRPDTEVKLGILNKFFPNKEQIIKVVDDRPSVIRMWRDQGLDVYDVGDGIEF